MLGFPTQTRYVLPFVILLLLFVLGMVMPDSYSSLLVFNTSLISEGQLWRLFTGHFIHSNLNHLYLNGAGLLLIWALHGEYYAKLALLPLVVAANLIIGILIFVFADYQNYFGFSGTIHFLLVWGALVDIAQKDKTGYLLLIGLILKVGYEQFTGGDPLTAKTIQANVATEAHLFGVVAAIFAYFLVLLLRQWKNKRTA